jgi:hypothetical protein
MAHARVTLILGDKVSENKTFLINAAHSCKVLDVARAEHKDGAAVSLYRSHGAPNQRFSIEPVGNDEYRIVANHSAKCLTVQYALQEPGTQVVQWGWGGGAHQRWRLEYDGGPLDGQAVRFVNTGSGLYLSVRGAQHADRTPLEIATPCSGLHQTFRLVDSRIV